MLRRSHVEENLTFEPVSDVVLSARGIVKQFPGVKALSDVQFTLRPGEVHSLMGENGAGKSTLIKVLTGVYQADSGEIRINNQLVKPRSTHEAESLGISTVYQEVNLIPHVSVAENICLGRVKSLFVNWKEMQRRAERAVEKVGIKIDVTEQLSNYSIAIQQLVAIARALDVQAKVLILDEPTSSLDKQEVAQLFSVIRAVKEKGLGIVFVSHFLDQIYAISDRITVLRNGSFIGEYEAKNLSRAELISKMMGKEFAGLAAHRASEKGQTSGNLFYEAKNFGRRGSLEPLDIEIRAGEVLGLAGLLGSGRTETARLIFGIDMADSGEVSIHGNKKSIRSPRDAIEAGVAFLPEDRKVQGIVPNLSVRENIALALQGRKGWMRGISKSAQLAMADRFIKALNIVTPGPEQPVRLLSGGNQQKVILARWLASEPRLLLLDEPTRGIDVGAKAEIEKLIAKLTAEGMAVLLISSDVEETVRNSTRAIVLRDRRKVADLTDVTEAAILQAIAAGDPKS